MVALFIGVAAMNTAMVAATTALTLIAADVGGTSASGLPNAAGVLGAAIGALTAGTVMARHGRRFALVATYTLAVCGALLALTGAAWSLLIAALAGMIMLGIGNGAAQLSRYVAAEAYPLERKGFALSTIVWGGTVGAVAGPALIAPAARLAHWLGLPELAGPVMIAAVVVAIAALASATLPSVPGTATARRPSFTMIGTALRRREVFTPLAAMVGAQVAMVAVMTMTPLQLHTHGHGLQVVGYVLSAHMIGMFALAPLSGRI